MTRPPILQYFNADHLPAPLREVSEPFARLADGLCCLPDNAERSVALRKLLEAKDAAVRAALDVAQPPRRADRPFPSFDARSGDHR